MWKVGDYFLSLKEVDLVRLKDKIYEVVDLIDGRPMFMSEGDSVVVLVSDINSICKLYKPTKLNRKLYPTYVEHNGYLIPKKAADKLNEQKDQSE